MVYGEEAQGVVDVEQRPSNPETTPLATATEVPEAHGLGGPVVAAAAATGATAAAIEDYTPVSYNYSFFHLIFALASMYIAMLLTGWGAVAQEKDRLDVGWTSVWVKIGAEWVTGLLYCWTLVAPTFFPDREFL